MSTSSSEDDQNSLFGSPPSTPRISLALPRTRTSTDAESAISNKDNNFENVGTTAHLGLHRIFDNVTSPVTVALPIRPPALRDNNMGRVMQNTHRTVPTTKQARKEGILPSKVVPPPQIQPTKKRATPVRVLAQPLDLPESSEGHSKGLLRSHPSLLGKAGTIARVRPSSIPPPISTSAQAQVQGLSVTNPILVDNGMNTNITSAATMLEESVRPLFKPRFAAVPSETIRSRASSITPNVNQTCVSSRDILSSAIFDQCINSQQISSPAVVHTLRQSIRFNRFLKDLIAFVRTVEAYARPEGDDADFRSPKRQKLVTKNPRASKYEWKGPQSGAGKMPPKLFQAWKGGEAKKLMDEFVFLLKQALETVNRENQIEEASEDQEVDPSSSRTKKRKTSDDSRNQDKTDDAALGLDQLWNMLREFNSPNSSGVSRSNSLEPTTHPTLSTLQDAAFPARPSTQPPCREPSVVAPAPPQAEQTSYEMDRSGEELDTVPPPTTLSLSIETDVFPGYQDSFSTYNSNDTDKGTSSAQAEVKFNVDAFIKELESATTATGFSTPITEWADLDSVPDVVGLDAVVSDPFPVMTDYGFEQFAFGDEMNSKQHIHDQSQATLDLFNPLSFEHSAQIETLDVRSAQSQMEMEDSIFWEIMAQSSEFQTSLPPPPASAPIDAINRDGGLPTAFDWQSVDPTFAVGTDSTPIDFTVPSTIDEGVLEGGVDDGAAVPAPTSNLPIPPTAPLSLLPPASTSAIASSQPLRTKLSAKKTATLPLPIPAPAPVPTINPNIARKHAVKARAFERRQKIIDEMEEIKKTLWKLTVEAGVLKHLAVKS